jgi:1-acyl-sn-glycerol-3-phosphate acyltransferase
MPYLPEFDEIRPYNDDEVPQVIERLVKEKGFIRFAMWFFPDISVKSFITKLLKVKTIHEFQLTFVYPILEQILKTSITQLTYSGIDNVQKGVPYIFITNHRDIVLDSALLNYVLYINGHDTAEIAIGSNLLINKWITDLVKLNRTFIVKRNVPGRKLYHYSYILSKYIRYTITEKKRSVWISQREGRTKDGDDKTQVSLIKMFNISGEKDWVSNYMEVNILPVTINYEIEPCDIEKVRELYLRSIHKDYKKSQLDDLNQMAGGMLAPKGRVHLTFGEPLNPKIPYLTRFPKKTFFQNLAKLVDTEIYKGYRLLPFNYVAAHLYFKDDNYAQYYKPEDKERFLRMMNEKLAKIEGDRQQLERLFLQIYANPVKNYFSVINSLLNVKQQHNEAIH